MPSRDFDICSGLADQTLNKDRFMPSELQFYGLLRINAINLTPVKSLVIINRNFLMNSDFFLARGTLLSVSAPFIVVRGPCKTEYKEKKMVSFRLHRIDHSL